MATRKEIEARALSGYTGDLREDMRDELHSFLRWQGEKATRWSLDRIAQEFDWWLEAGGAAMVCTGAEPIV